MEKIKVYIGKPNSAFVTEHEYKNLDDFFKTYKPQDVNIPTSTAKYRDWKRKNMKGAIIGELSENRRSNATMISRTALLIDFDYIKPKYTTREQLLSVLATFRLKMFVYPSMGNGLKGLRYRICIPLDKPLDDKDLYEATVSYFNNGFKRAGILRKIDGSNKTWSQLAGLPVLTQFSSDEERKNPVATLKGETLKVDTLKKKITIAEAKKARPEDQARMQAATEFVHGKDPRTIIKDFVENHKEWLTQYSNYLACQFELQYAEKQGQIDHSTALELVSMLAGDNTREGRENQQKYEKENHAPTKGRGLAYFVSAKQVASSVSWLSFDEKGKVHVDIPKLGDTLLSQYHYVASETIASKSILWNGHRWVEANARPLMLRIISQKLRSVGLWSRHTLSDTMLYVETMGTCDWLSNRLDHSNPYLVTFRNGAYDLKSGILREAEAKDYNAVTFNRDFEPNARLHNKPEVTLAWINALVNSDTMALQNIIQFIGYCFTRSYDKAIMLVLTGSGSNGKSTFLDYLVSLLGTENTASATLSALADSNQRFVTSTLYHKTANVFADISNSFIKELGMIKALTGRDQIQAEYKGKNPFTFTNYAKLVFSANELPALADSTYGLKRRLRVVDFPLAFKDEAFIREFAKQYPMAKIQREKDDFIYYCLQVYRDTVLNTPGLAFPESPQMVQAKDKWFAISDSAQAFIDANIFYDDRLYSSKNGETRSALFTMYKKYSLENGLKPVAKAKFEAKLQRRFPQAEVIRNKRQGVVQNRWRGIMFSSNFFEEGSGMETLGLDSYSNFTKLLGYDAWQDQQN